MDHDKFPFLTWNLPHKKKDHKPYHAPRSNASYLGREKGPMTNLNYSLMYCVRQNEQFAEIIPYWEFWKAESISSQGIKDSAHIGLL